ncbi:expressed unknown protein [Seminavis robusta]|uniref:Uncharacterized protein n=1 Tax=Seminavis robusta TaxID=568900 RepID=A0A9N8H6D8_9STRA|nr:expressed unknown protein [Seminavis robusta]|eukprot:Sro42_g025410.1 n/a (197) ;mRNA; f:16512-17206
MADTDYALADKQGATPVVQGTEAPDGVFKTGAGGVKRGHKCCGGCCDVRRATIIVNIISMVLGVVGVLFMITAGSIASNLDASNYDDDEMVAAINELEGTDFGGSMGVAIALSSVRILLNAAGIWGALKYNVVGVGAGLVAYGLEFLFSLITFNIVGLIWNGFFAYPHVYLIMEMRNGIMNAQTYEDIEKQSCCCV